METENSQNVFSVSITHNSKIRELSDGNRVIVCQTTFFAMGPTIFELWVMKTENWVMEITNPNSPLVFFLLIPRADYLFKVFVFVLICMWFMNLKPPTSRKHWLKFYSNALNVLSCHIEHSWDYKILYP